MENDNKELRIRHIRLSVREDTEERGFYWKREKIKVIPERNYAEGVEKILQSSFTVAGKQFNIFKITLSGNPTPSEIDEIFDWFKAKPTVYLSSQEILLKSTSKDFRKVTPKLIKKTRKVIREFVEEVTILRSKDKMASQLHAILQTKDHPENLKLILFLVPGFDKREIEDLYGQISSLITQSGNLEILDLDNGILLSSATVEDTRSIVEKPYIFHISEDVELQTLEEPAPLKMPPDLFPPKDDDPVVCVIDTGADPETLGSALIECSHEDDLPDGIDKIGHGTCVSSVVIWGQDMFSEKNKVTGRCRVVSHKFMPSGSMSIYRAAYNAVSKFSSFVKVFNLSVNFKKPDRIAEIITTYLDQRIQAANVVLVNSVGNIPPWWIEKTGIKQGYPQYLTFFPILPPAVGNSIVGVGSYAMKSSKNLAKKYQVSPYSPLGKSTPVYESSQKPDILVRGGNYELENGKVIRVPELGVPVFRLNNEFSREFGTSVAAPLAASLLAQLYSSYPDISNSETVRAILLSVSDLINTSSGLIFQLKDEEALFSSKSSLIYYAEGVLPARISHIQATRKFQYVYNEIDFFVPKEASRIEIISVHSDDLPVSRLGFLRSILKVDVYRPRRFKKLGSADADVWCLKRNTPVNFAVFTAVPGMWNLRLAVESTGLPRRLSNELMVRYGLAIRVDLQEELTTPLRAVRETVLQEVGILQ